MFTGQFAVISNRATWLSDVIEIEDEDDGSTLDFSTDPRDIAIDVYIKSMDGCTLKLGTLDNGIVQIIGPGFQFRFDDLSSLCAGTYLCGIKVTIDDYADDLVLGTVTVLQGN